MAAKSMNAEPYGFKFDPKTAAHVIIDMQRDFVESRGFGESLGNYVSILRTAIAPTNQVLDVCRKAGMMTIRKRESHWPDACRLPR